MHDDDSIVEQEHTETGEKNRFSPLSLLPSVPLSHCDAESESGEYSDRLPAPAQDVNNRRTGIASIRVHGRLADLSKNGANRNLFRNG